MGASGATQSDGQPESDPEVTAAIDLKEALLPGAPATANRRLLTDVLDQVLLFVLDCIAGYIFWFLLGFDGILWYLPEAAFWSVWGILLGVGILWRVLRCHVLRASCRGCQISPVDVDGVVGTRTTAFGPLAPAGLPYTCGYAASADGTRELYLVATVHIAPRAAADVKAVVEAVCPHIVLIELDEERIDHFRPKQAEEEDLQPLHLIDGASMGSGRAATLHACRALWNAEWAGHEVSGPLVFDPSDVYGMGKDDARAAGHISLVLRGGPPSSPASAAHSFANKGHLAARRGASALVTINRDNNDLPVRRIGFGSLMGELRVFYYTLNCGFPPIPVLMVSQSDGEALQKAASETGRRASVQFRIMDDHYPRRTLRRALCQQITLMLSGVGVLYGIVRCMAIDVGEEFLAAERSAAELGVPCLCIDSNMQQLCSRLAWSLLPTPKNLLNALWSWLAIPRVLVTMLFPGPSRVDVLGVVVLNAASLRCWTWFGFLLAAGVANLVTTSVLRFFTGEAVQAGEAAHIVSPKNALLTQLWVMDGLMLYAMPCIYEAILASRDEAMYNGLRVIARASKAKRLVAVTGAAHTNGILQKCWARGL